ncbi:MAG: hypothetical protein QM564_00175 [Bergeyella sp.]
MKKKIHLFFIFAFLGIFIIPKQNFYAHSLAETENCCKTGNEEKDCCTKNHNDKKDCKNHSCCAVHTCCFPVIASIREDFSPEISFVDYSAEEKSFDYKTPYFSSRLKEIWQPPKIG